MRSTAFDLTANIQRGVAVALRNKIGHRIIGRVSRNAGEMVIGDIQTAGDLLRVPVIVTGLPCAVQREPPHGDQSNVVQSGHDDVKPLRYPPEPVWRALVAEFG